MNKAAKVISDAIVGNDYETVIVKEKPYTIYPPSIHQTAGAISCLSSANIGDCNSFKDLFNFFLDSEQLAKALSYLVQDNEELYEELSKGTHDEIISALEIGFSLVSSEVFLRAVNLMKSVQRMAAKEKL